MTQDRRAWSLITKTRGGVVSILKELTLAECRAAYHRLNPLYGYTYQMIETPHGGWKSQARHVSEKDIELREVIGPEDWDPAEVSTWDHPWPKTVNVSRAELERLGLWPPG